MVAKSQTLICDPITRDAWALFGAVRRLTSELFTVTRWPSHTPVSASAKLIAELEQLTREQRLFLSRFNAALASGLSLGFLLSNREEAEGFIQRLQQSHKHLNARELALALPKLQSDTLKVLHGAFAQLYGRLELITPSHVTLNSHFTKLIGALETYTMSAADTEFFSSLATLRDEYFEAPSEPKLREYAQLSELIVGSDRYRLYLVERTVAHTIHNERSHRRELDTLTNELEVACLTEVLNSNVIA